MAKQRVLVDSYHKQWCDKNGLVMSGKNLSGMVGCSMQKLRLLIARQLIAFPKPVKTRRLGKISINYYKKDDVLAFVSTTDVKAIKVFGFDGVPLKKDAAINAEHKNMIPLPLYCQFMGIRADLNKIKNHGIGSYR